MEKKTDDIIFTLTVQQKEFCTMYLSGMSAVDAFRESGLGSGTTDDMDLASALLRAPLVRAYIDHMHRTAASRSIVSLEAIDQRLTDIAMADIVDALEISDTYVDDDGVEHTPVTLKHPSKLTPGQRACITSIKTIDGGLEVKCADKLKALEMLVKRRGGFVNTSDLNVSGELTTVFAMCDDNGRGGNQDSD